MAVKTTGAQYSSTNSLYAYEKADLVIFSMKKTRFFMLVFLQGFLCHSTPYKDVSILNAVKIIYELLKNNTLGHNIVITAC